MHTRQSQSQMKGKKRIAITTKTKGTKTVLKK